MEDLVKKLEEVLGEVDINFNFETMGYEISESERFKNPETWVKILSYYNMLITVKLNGEIISDLIDGKITEEKYEEKIKDIINHEKLSSLKIFQERLSENTNKLF